MCSLVRPHKLLYYVRPADIESVRGLLQTTLSHLCRVNTSKHEVRGPVGGAPLIMALLTFGPRSQSRTFPLPSATL